MSDEPTLVIDLDQEVNRVMVLVAARDIAAECAELGHFYADDPSASVRDREDGNAVVEHSERCAADIDWLLAEEFAVTTEVPA